MFALDGACNTGIKFGGDTANAAILFVQRNNRVQPIKWYYGVGKREEATLTVSPVTGELNFTGNASFDGSVRARGLSGDDKAARNLRGKHVPVKSGDTSVTVTFATPEADEDYAVFIEQNWISNRAVVKRDANGFVVQFEKPAPDEAKLDWLIVR